MLTARRLLPFPVLALAACLAFPAQARDEKPGFKAQLLYKEVRDGRGAEVVTRSEGHRSPVNLLFWNGKEGKNQTVFMYPANPKGSLEAARFEVVQLFGLPTAFLKKDLHVEMDTDGRPQEATLAQEVKPAPSGKHNELIITVVRKTAEFELRLEVKAVPN